MADKQVNIIFQGDMRQLTSTLTNVEGKIKRLGSAINSATSGLSGKL